MIYAMVHAHGARCNVLAVAHFGRERLQSIEHWRAWRARSGRNHADAREIPRHVVRILVAEQWVDDEPGRRAPQQRVAVRVRVRCCLCADDSARAAAIFDHDRLAERGRKLFGDDARSAIGATPRCKGHDHADTPIGFAGAA